MRMCCLKHFPSWCVPFQFFFVISRKPVGTIAAQLVFFSYIEWQQVTPLKKELHSITERECVLLSMRTTEAYSAVDFFKWVEHKNIFTSNSVLDIEEWKRLCWHP